MQFKFAYDGEGNYGFLGADGSLIPFHKKALEYAYMYRISTNSYAGFIIDSNYTVISGDFGTQLSSGTALKITQNSSGSAISGLKAGRYNIYKNGVAIEENVYHDENTTLVYITSGYDKSNLYIAEYLGN